MKPGGDQTVVAPEKKQWRATEPDALTVDEVARRGPVRKGTIYKEIAAGRLRARKLGRRTVILRFDYQEWLNGLPLLNPFAAVPTAEAGPPGEASRPMCRRRARPPKCPTATCLAPTGDMTAGEAQ